MFEFDPKSVGIEVGSWAPIRECRWAQIGWNAGVFLGADSGEIEVACWVWVWNQIDGYRGGLLRFHLGGTADGVGSTCSATKVKSFLKTFEQMGIASSSRMIQILSNQDGANGHITCDLMISAHPLKNVLPYDERSKSEKNTGLQKNKVQSVSFHDSASDVTTISDHPLRKTFLHL